MERYTEEIAQKLGIDLFDALGLLDRHSLEQERVFYILLAGARERNNIERLVALQDYACSLEARDKYWATCDQVLSTLLAQASKKPLWLKHIDALEKLVCHEDHKDACHKAWDDAFVAELAQVKAGGSIADALGLIGLAKNQHQVRLAEEVHDHVIDAEGRLQRHASSPSLEALDDLARLEEHTLRSERLRLTCSQAYDKMFYQLLADAENDEMCRELFFRSRNGHCRKRAVLVKMRNMD